MEGDKGVFRREDWEYLLVQIASEHAGVDFFSYKMNTLRRRYMRRMGARNLTSLSDYVAVLEKSTEEAAELASDFLIGVTSFFRDPEAFKVIEQKVLPDLFTRAAGEPVRVWVAGCSRGYEVYSLAMLLQDYCRTIDKGDFIVFATDISEESVHTASKAVFRRETVDALPERFRSMVTETSSGFTVIPDIRRRLVFNRHDLLEDPPFSRTDLVSCRNLVMYLKEESQRKVMGRLLFSLKQEGILFMGNGESPSGFNGCLEVVDGPWRIFRKCAELNRPVEFLFSDSPRRSGPAQPSAQNDTFRDNPGRGLSRASFDTCLTQTFVPPCLFVDESFQLLHLHGDLNELLSIPSGFPNVDLLTMLPPEFRGRVRAGVREVLREGTPVEIKNLPWREGGVNLGITRVSPAGMGGVCLVTFTPGVTPLRKVVDNAVLSSDAKSRIGDLEHQLDSLEQELRLVRDDLSNRTGELQAANEELLTGGEEIRSTNEELQAINEELLSANEELKSRNQQLSELHSDMGNLLRSLDVSAIFLGTDLRIRKFNEAARLFFRFDEKDSGRVITDIASNLSGSCITDILDRVDRVMARGGSDQWELNAGELGWFLAKATPHRDEKGALTGTILSFVDVTGLKKAENMLRGLERRLRRTHSMAMVGCWDFVPDNGLIMLTSDTRTILGWEENTDSIPFTEFCRLFRDQSGIHDAFNDLIYSRSRMDFSTVTARDGTRHVRLVAELEYDNRGEPVRISGAVQDVTGIMEARRSMEDAHDYLKRIQNAAALGGFRMEWDTMTGLSRVDLSAEACGILGIEQRSDHGVHLREIVSIEEWEKIQEVLRESAKNGRTAEVDFSLSGGDNTRKRVFRLRATSQSKSDRIMQTTGVIMDVTGLRQIEQELHHSEKLRSVGELAGGVAHDFNNQLMGIVGYAEGILKRVDDPDLQRMVQGILKASERSADLIRQLLAFSRKGMSVVSVVDLHKVATDVLSMVERSIDRRIEIRYMLNAELTTVFGDESQLNNAILNLVLNSRDAIAGKGFICLSTRNLPSSGDSGRSSYVEIIVEDNGKGMEPAVVERAFEPFFTTKPVGHGTGMGLSAVYGTVNAHRGQINIQSEPGKGTKVTMVFPLSPTDSMVVDEHGTEPVPVGVTARILVVDDEEMVRGILADLLISGGYHVLTAADGENALRVFRRDPEAVDLVLMDMTMPRMNGLDAFLEMKKLKPSVRVMILSGHSAAGTAHELRRHGIRGVLQKPITARPLLEAVSAALS
ncbi:MAG: CheR family methyltransferase [Candidatus Fermentibacteraceae bacterium]